MEKFLTALKSTFAKVLITSIVLLKKSFYLPQKNYTTKKQQTIACDYKYIFDRPFSRV